MPWTIVTIRNNDVRDAALADVLMTLADMGVRVVVIQEEEKEEEDQGGAWPAFYQRTGHRFLQGGLEEQDEKEEKEAHRNLSSPFRAVLRATENEGEEKGGKEQSMVAFVDMRQLVAMPAKEWQFLSFVASFTSLSSLSTVYIPGTWDKVLDLAVLDTIHWRFQGGFFFGSNAAMRRFCETILASLDTFLASNAVPVDVNLLAWAEYVQIAQPITWYAASSQPWSYLSSMPPEVYLHPLEADEVVALASRLPVLPGYRPSSIAFVQEQEQKKEEEGKEGKEGKEVHWWCVRYVDYYVLDDGAYLLPEGSHGWHTRNLLVREEDNREWTTWWLDEVFPDDIETNPGAQCTGIEDVRLYFDTTRGVLRFVGTNLDHAPFAKNVMVSGSIVLQEETSAASLHVDSVWLPPAPDHDTVQKNWLPLGVNRWMYTPFSFVVAEAIETPSCSLISTRIAERTFYDDEDYGSRPWFVERLRGSTVPVPYPLDPSKRILMTHFVVDRPGQRRAYGHVLLLLDQEGRPVQRSQPFCFVRADIEYCIGMHVLQDQWQVFVSQCDRDPLRLRYVWSRVSWHAMAPVSACVSVTRDDVFRARGVA